MSACVCQIFGYQATYQIAWVKKNSRDTEAHFEDNKKENTMC